MEKVVLLDESDEKKEFEVVMTFQVNNNDYAALLPVEGENEKVLLFRVENKDEDALFKQIVDKDEFDIVVNAYNELINE